MRAFGIFLMIVSGALDIVSIAMIGSSSFESFKTVIIISSSAFFIGLLLTIFGGTSNSNNNNVTTNTNNGGFDRLVNSDTDASKWRCKNCGELNSNTVYTCTRCGDRKRIQSAYNANSTVPVENGWKCSKCGKINQNYVGTCGCGMRKQNNTPISQRTAVTSQESQETIKKSQINISTADEIKRYKELLDTGAITQEEYDRKKKELLGF